MRRYANNRRRVPLLVAATALFGGACGLVDPVGPRLTAEEPSDAPCEEIEVKQIVGTAASPELGSVAKVCARSQEQHGSCIDEADRPERRACSDGFVCERGRRIPGPTQVAYFHTCQPEDKPRPPRNTMPTEIVTLTLPSVGAEGAGGEEPSEGGSESKGGAAGARTLEAFAERMARKYSGEGIDQTYVINLLEGHDQPARKIAESLKQERNSARRYESDSVTEYYQFLKPYSKLTSRPRECLRDSGYAVGDNVRGVPVPAKVVATILYLESDCKAFPESPSDRRAFLVRDVLTTLCFHYPAEISAARTKQRRDQVFCPELEAFVRARKLGRIPEGAKGNYLGAMGAPQFLPTAMFEAEEVLRRKVTYNDLNSFPNAFEVAAAKLRHDGWKGTEPIYFRLSGKPNVERALSLKTGRRVPPSALVTNDTPPQTVLSNGHGLPSDHKGIVYWMVRAPRAAPEYFYEGPNLAALNGYNRLLAYAAAVHEGSQIR
jgi:membrane-bound lytic murein transglycosylase B